MKSAIIDINSREILDSRGNPTVESECLLENGIVGRGAVPSGASTGEREALELRDKEDRYGGKGVQKAVSNVKNIIAPEMIGRNCLQQSKLDRIMCEMDGTENKSKLGANAILSVSMAVARASSNLLGIPLYRYLGGINSRLLPVPQCNILNGGAHAGNNLDIQEFMIVPTGASSFREAIRWASEIFHELKNVLLSRGLSTGIGDEGGFSPNLESNEEALKLILRSIKEAGYEPEKDINIAMDVAASELYSKEKRKYDFENEKLTSKELISIYEQWIQKYPIISIEDGLGESDWKGWKSLTQSLGDKIQIVGDDIFVTNTKIIKRGIEEKAANSSLIKLNQIGTVTETIDAINISHRNEWTTVISHRSGETADTFISHLSVGMNTGQIKSGSLSRIDRVEKYNELLRIEEEIGDAAQFPGKEIFIQKKTIG